MCNFFSCLVDRKGKVYTDGNITSHSELVKKFDFDDSLDLDDPKRNFVKVELIPKKFSNRTRKGYKYVLDEKRTPKWVNDRHEKNVWNYFKKNYLDQIWYKNTQIKIKEIKKIKWFRPMNEPNIKELNPLADDVKKTFKLEKKLKIRLIPLENSKDWDVARAAAGDAARDTAWDAARDVARDAAWDTARDTAWDAAWDTARDAARAAAWDTAWDTAWDDARDVAWAAAGDAARDATYEIGSDKNQKYKSNPFSSLMNLWDMGFYVCGVKNNVLILGYVPKKKKKRIS